MDSEEYHSAQESLDSDSFKISLSKDDEEKMEAESGRHGSPMSRNTYTFTTVLSSSSVVRVAVLSKWDNIMGPKPVHVWKQWASQQKEDTTSNCVEYIVGHTLVAEELNNLANIECHVVAAWFHVPQEAMLFAAATFQVADDEGNTPHCFSIAFDSNHTTQVFEWKQLIMDWLLVSASKVKAFLVKRNFSLVDDIVKSCLHSLHDQLDSLLRNRLCRCPLDHCVGLMADKLLVERALSSHLQTASSSVVIASNEQQANQMLNILSYLMPKDKLSCSRSVVSQSSDRFHAGLALQGLVLEDGVNLTEKDLLSSGFPLTVVDLRCGVVKQGLLLPLHLRIHQAQLLKSLTDASPQVFGCYQQIIKEGAPLVRCFLKDLLKLPPSEWPAYFLLFYRQLHYRALSLISFVQDRMEKYRTERGALWRRGLEKSVKKFLGLEQQDLCIVVSLAEYLQPGVTQLLTPSHN